MNDKILGILQTLLGCVLFLILITAIIMGKIAIKRTIVIVALILALANMAYGIYLILINRNKNNKTK